jgi:peroxiredoxin
MNQASAPNTVNSAAKKGVVLAILIAAVGICLAFILLKPGTRGAKIITEGDGAPEFALTAVDGRTIKLSDLRGKVVMVHFWATWCPPCVDEIPTLDKLYRAMFGKEFELLAVSVDESGAAGVVPFLQRNRLVLPVLLDQDHGVAKRYGTFKFPETYILDRNGIVRFKIIGARNWADPGLVQELQRLVAAP